MSGSLPAWWGKQAPKYTGGQVPLAPWEPFTGCGSGVGHLVSLGVGVVPSRAARLVVSPVTLPRSLVMSTQLPRPPPGAVNPSSWPPSADK